MPSSEATNGQTGSELERVALYLRVSSEEQVDAGTIQTQREFLDNYVDFYGQTVVDAYADEGVSGTVGLHERPGGRRLLEDAKARRFDTVLLYRLDRIGRKLLVVVDAHDRLEEVGVALKSATEPIDTSTPAGRMYLQILASFSEFERETIRQRTSDGLGRALRNGKHLGVLPYGYDMDEQGNYVVVEEEAEIVRQIFTNIASGSTLYAKAKRLNAEGVPSPGHRYRGKPRKHGASWIHSTIARLVHQSAYSGTHRAKTKNGEIERPVPAILEAALQKRAISRLAENKQYSGGRRTRSYLLRGLIVCERCGVGYVGFPAKKDHYRYHKYACTRWKKRYERRAMELDCPRVSGNWLERIVWADVKRFLSDPGEVLERVRAQLSDDDACTELEVRRTSLRKKCAAAEEEKARLIRSYAKGTLDEPELEIALPDVRNRIETLQLLIDSVESDLAARQQDRLAAQNTEAWLRTLADNLEAVEGDSPEAFERRRELVRWLVEKITAARDENGHTRVEITYRFAPPDEAVVESRVAESEMFEEVPIPGY
jgi:site-specific DNA recombinase